MPVTELPWFRTVCVDLILTKSHFPFLGLEPHSFQVSIFVSLCFFPSSIGMGRKDVYGPDPSGNGACVVVERVKTTVPVEFLKEGDRIDPEFLCAKCRHILVEPCLLEPCGHIVCRCCAVMRSLEGSAKSRQNVCPVDNLEYTVCKDPPKEWIDRLSKVEVRCFYHANGCPLIMHPDQFCDHEDECSFGLELPCTGGCGAELGAEERETHSCVKYLKEKVNKLRSSRNELYKVKYKVWSLENIRESSVRMIEQRNAHIQDLRDHLAAAKAVPACPHLD